MARAIINRPRVLLADEPTGNLDEQTGNQVIDLLFSLHEKLGTTLVLITHDAELAARCTGDHDRTYVWWQAEAWAGKTALMATFVLNPPPGVRVVSFFITARYAGQSDRRTFLEHPTRSASRIVRVEVHASVRERVRRDIDDPHHGWPRETPGQERRRCIVRPLRSSAA